MGAKSPVTLTVSITCGPCAAAHYQLRYLPETTALVRVWNLQEQPGVRGATLRKLPFAVSRTAQQPGLCRMQCSLTLVPATADAPSPGKKLLLEYAAVLLSTEELEHAVAMGSPPAVQQAPASNAVWKVAEGRLVGEELFRFETQRVEYPSPAVTSTAELQHVHHTSKRART